MERFDDSISVGWPATLARPVPGCNPHASQPVSVAQEPANCFGNCFGRSNWDEKTGFSVYDQVVGAGVPGYDNRQPTGHRFLLNQSAPFDNRGQDKDIAAL